MSRQPRDGRCWYCGEEHLAEEDPLEHIIPAAIGGALATSGVAESCNNELGRRIDQPFLSDWFVAEARSRHDIRDPRRPGDCTRVPKVKGHLVDGSPVRIDMTDGWRPEILPGGDPGREELHGQRPERGGGTKGCSTEDRPPAQGRS